MKRIFLALFAAATIATGMGGATASADPNDALFITRLTEAGFTMGNMSTVATEAKVGCTYAIISHNPHDIADFIWKTETLLSFNEVTQVATIAAEVYCPVVLSYAKQRASGTWT